MQPLHNTSRVHLNIAKSIWKAISLPVHVHACGLGVQGRQTVDQLVSAGSLLGDSLFCSGKVSFYSIRLWSVWMRLTHITEGNLLHSKLSHSKTPSQKHSKWRLTKYLGTMPQTSGHKINMHTYFRNTEALDFTNFIQVLFVICNSSVPRLWK